MKLYHIKGTRLTPQHYRTRHSVGCRLSGGLTVDDDGSNELMNAVALSRVHGFANLVGGLWPLLHINSFEVVFGPKTDRWLVKTVAGLLIANGLTQLRTSSSAASMRQARRLGLGTAAVLAGIDLIYVPAGRISPMYLADAALEVGWIVAWMRADMPTGSPPRTR